MEQQAGGTRSAPRVAPVVPPVGTARSGGDEAAPAAGHRPPAGRPRTVPGGLPAVLAAGTVLTQMTYPLLDGRWRTLSTVLAVLLFTAASAGHSWRTRGGRWTASYLLVAGGTGLGAEALGVSTGWPFGPYTYAGTLGPQVLGVPVIVVLAWSMMSYPCLVLGQRLGGRHRIAAALAGAWTLAAWDLFLDPQMIAAGHWRFQDPLPALPGLPGTPLTNYAGWLLVAAVIMLLMQVVPGPPGRGGAAARPPRRTDEAVPAALLGWTWLGSSLANLAFFGRPWAALYGGLAMGVTVAPYLYRFRRQDRPAHPGRVPRAVAR